MTSTFAPKILLLACLTLLFAGCATTHTDWNTRVNSYTYDQAVTELGPPDKQAKLTDGRTVAEWITRYNTGSTAIVSPGFYPNGGGGIIQSTGPNYYEDRLRLTFGTNHVLTAWTKK